MKRSIFLLLSKLSRFELTYHYSKKITICNIYLQNSQPDPQEILTDLSQLPKPILILGDFNSHNILWGSSYSDSRGKIIENIIDRTELILLNNGCPTHICLAYNSFSAIDLTISICSTSIAQDIKWRTDNYTYDSDHYPIHLQLDIPNMNNNPSPQLSNTTWNIKKADWINYTRCATQYFNKIQELLINEEDPDILLDTFIQHINNIAEHTFPKFRNFNCKRTLPWWNSKCSGMVKTAKSAFNRYKKHQYNDFLKTEFKKHRARAGQILNQEKKNAWIHFISSSLNNYTPIDRIWKTINCIRGYKKNDVSYVLFDQNNLPYCWNTLSIKIL